MDVVKINKKDVLITILSIIFLFGGIPLLLWGYAHVRANVMLNRHTQEIRKLVSFNTPDKDIIITALYDDFEKLQKIRKTYLYTKYSNPLESAILTNEACQKLILEMVQSYELASNFDMSHWAIKCDLVLYLTEKDIYIFSSYDSIKRQALVSEEYAIDLKSLLDNSDEIPVETHWHKGTRELHILTLLSGDPLLVWDVVLREKDRRY